MTPIALRAATPGDSEFCYQLHKAAMGGYITAIWGWDEQELKRRENLQMTLDSKAKISDYSIANPAGQEVAEVRRQVREVLSRILERVAAAAGKA